MAAYAILTALIGASFTFDPDEMRAPQLRLLNFGEAKISLGEGDIKSQEIKADGQYQGFDGFVRVSHLSGNFQPRHRDHNGISASDFDFEEQGLAGGIGYLWHAFEQVGIDLDFSGRLSSEYHSIRYEGYSSREIELFNSVNRTAELEYVPQRVKMEDAWRVTCLALGAAYHPPVREIKKAYLSFQQFFENKAYPGLLTANPERAKSFDDRTRFDLGADTEFGLHGEIGAYLYFGEWRATGAVGFRFAIDSDFPAEGLCLEIDPTIAYLDYTANPYSSQIEYRLGCQFSALGANLFRLDLSVIDLDNLGLRLTAPLSGKYHEGLQLEVGLTRNRHRYNDGNAFVLHRQYDGYNPRFQERVTQEIFIGCSYMF